MSKNKKWLLLALKILIAGALIVFVLSRIDLATAKARLSAVAPGMLVLAALAFLFQYVVCALRWRSVLTALGGRIAIPRIIHLFYMGTFFHQTLPASVGGDAVRAYLTYRDGIGLRISVSGIMLERVCTIAGLVLLVALAQPAFLPRVGAETGAWMVYVVAGATAAMIGGIVFLSLLDRIPETYRRWRAVAALAKLAADTRTLFFNPLAAFRSLAWSVLGHANLALAIYLLARGLHLDVGLLDCLALFPPVLLMTALPISIAGWGVREGSMVYAFGLIGVAASDALILSVLYGLLTLVLALPGGLVWLAGGGSTKELTQGLAATKQDSPAAGKP
jgi:hypothetical protein